MNSMKVSELVATGECHALTLPEGEREIGGVYIGDLLSWVMGRASADEAWITIMSNINVVAVASLADTSCVLFAEGVVPDDNVINTAAEKGINLLVSDRSAYELAVLLHERL